MKKQLLIILFALWSVSLMAVDVSTSITTISHEGDDQLLGSFTLTFTDNAFPSASGTTPVYIRFRLSSAVGWSKTLVDLRSDAPDSVRRPINIALAPTSSSVALNPAMPPTTLQLVRLVEGEQSGWLRVTYPTTSWLESGGLFQSPEQDKEVACSLGIRGEDSRRPGANTASGGNEHSSSPYLISTLLRANYRGTPGFGVGDIEELNFIAFDQSTVGVENGSPVPGDNAGVAFSNDPSVARGEANLPCFEFHFEADNFDGDPYHASLNRMNLFWREEHRVKAEPIYLTNSSDFEWQVGSRLLLTLPQVDPVWLVRGEQGPDRVVVDDKLQLLDEDLEISTTGGEVWEVRKIYIGGVFVGYDLELMEREYPIYGQVEINGLTLSAEGWFTGRSLTLSARAFYKNRSIAGDELKDLGTITRRTLTIERGEETFQRAILPFTGHGREDWDVEIHIVNQSPTPSTVTGFFYQRQGIHMRTISLAKLGAYGSMRIKPSEAFDSFADDLSWLELLSDQPVMAIGVVEGKTGETLDIFSSVAESEEVLYGSHIPENTSVWQSRAYVIASEFDLDSAFTLHLPGEEVDLKYLRAPRYSMILDTSDLQASGQPGAWFKVEATDKAASGIFFFERADDGSQLASISLNQKPQASWSFDHLGAVNNGWWNGLILFNPNPSEVSATLKAFGENGESLGSTTLTVSGETRLAELIAGLLPGVHASRLEVEASGELVAGLLMGRQDQEILTHIPGNNLTGKSFLMPWLPEKIERWMGMAITNTVRLTNRAEFTPIKANGEMGEPRAVIIPPNGKTLALLGELFDDLNGYRTMLIKSNHPIRIFGITGNDGQLATVPIKHFQ